MTIKPAHLDCKECGYMLLVDDELDVVFCQNCKTESGKFKQVKPKYNMYIPK